MVATIVLNQSNIVPDGNNNTFVYNFPNSVSFPNHDIAIQSISMFYSWTNLNVNLSNNKFSFIFPTNSLGSPSTGVATASLLDITIPDGQYEISDLNALVQFYCIQNGYYFINSAGQNVYYLEMVVNATQYGIQINTFPLPEQNNFVSSIVSGYTLWTGTVAPYIGWTTPLPNTQASLAGFQGFPDNTSALTYNPTFFFPADFNKIVGFPAGTYTYGTNQDGTLVVPTIASLVQSVNLSFLSTVTPQVQPNSSIYFAITNIENNYAIPNSIIYSINPNVAFGLQINENPPQFAYNKLLNGTYNSLRLQILGLNYQPLQILDPAITIVLVIRNRKDDLGILSSLVGGK